MRGAYNKMSRWVGGWGEGLWLSTGVHVTVALRLRPAFCSFEHACRTRRQRAVYPRPKSSRFLSLSCTECHCHRIALASPCRLTPEQLAAGVICSSAGNHAQVSPDGGEVEWGWGWGCGAAMHGVMCTWWDDVVTWRSRPMDVSPWWCHLLLLPPSLRRA